jgi:hypothetical protein
MESLANLLEEQLRYSFDGSKMGGVGQLTILFCYLDSSEKKRKYFHKYGNSCPI